MVGLSAPAGSEPRRSARLLGALGIVALVALTYGRTIGHGFAFDDQMLVLDNPMVRRPPWSALEALSRADVGYSYRPVRVIAYQLDHLVAGGLEPAVFHASNLIWHAAAALVLLGLARATLGAESGALAAAALFAVHPLGSEAVAYVAGRRDLVATTFALLALRAWWWFVASRADAAVATARRAAALVAAAAAGILAVGAKETALVVPFVAALLAAVHARKHGASTARAVAGPFAAALGLLVILALTAVLVYPDRLAPILARLGEPALAPQPALTLRVLGQYVALAVWPGHLSADYRSGAFALPESSLDAPALASAAVLALAIAAGLWLVWRGRIAGAGVLWFLAALAPVAQLVPYGEVVAEHNAYLGLPGLALAFGEGVEVAARRWPRSAPALAAALVVVLAGRTFVRAADWRDDETLWSATLEVAPGSLRARYNLGVALVDRGRLVEGRESLRAAHAIAPDDRDVLLALAGVEARLGENERALGLADRAVALRRDAAALATLGWSQLASGRAGEAAASFEESLELAESEAVRRGLELARRQGGRP